MNKILCLFVVIAAIAQVYADTAPSGAAPAPAPAPAGAPAPQPGASNNNGLNPLGLAQPLVKMGRDMVGEGQKAVNGLFGGFSAALDAFGRH